MQLENPYLIQRLCKPKEKLNPYGFGGGLPQGGFSKDGIELLAPLFSFDYMGAAEFEHGKVPEAFAVMLNMEAAGKMTAGSLRYKCDVSRYGAKKYGITAAGTMGFYSLLYAVIPPPLGGRI